MLESISHGSTQIVYRFPFVLVEMYSINHSVSQATTDQISCHIKLQCAKFQELVSLCEEFHSCVDNHVTSSHY